MKAESFEEQPIPENKEEIQEQSMPSEESAIKVETALSPEKGDLGAEEIPPQEFTKEGTAEIQEDIDPQKMPEAAAESVEMQAVHASEYGGKQRVRKIAAAAFSAIALASALSPSVAEARHNRRRLSWEDVGKVAVVMTIGGVLGGGYYGRRHSSSGRGYRDPYRYQSQIEQAEIRRQQAVEIEQLHLERERIRQEEETNRKALEKGILPQRYRERSPESREGRESEKEHQEYEAPLREKEKTPSSEEYKKPPEEKREISQERKEEVEVLGEMAGIFKIGYEDGHAECEAAQRYGKEEKPVLTRGRWAELLMEHNKPKSKEYLEGFIQGWTQAGGVRD